MSKGIKRTAILKRLPETGENDVSDSIDQPSRWERYSRQGFLQPGAQGCPSVGGHGDQAGVDRRGMAKASTFSGSLPSIHGQSILQEDWFGEKQQSQISMKV
jgi:hypothetical protein